MKKILLTALISLGAIGFIATTASANSEATPKVEKPAKCESGKCGEGKCGGDKSKKKEDAKDESKEKAKGKCGEGKCGSK